MDGCGESAVAAHALPAQSIGIGTSARVKVQARCGIVMGWLGYRKWLLVLGQNIKNMTIKSTSEATGFVRAKR